MATFVWASVLKSVAIVATAAAGLYAAVFELRTSGGLTRHGRIVASIIVIGGIVALAIQINDTSDALEASKNLNIQMARQRVTLREVREANSQLGSTLANVRIVRQEQIEVGRMISTSIREQRRAVAEINHSVVTATASTRQSLKVLDSEIARTQEHISYGVARLARPLKDITFKYRLVLPMQMRHFRRITHSLPV